MEHGCDDDQAEAIKEHLAIGDQKSDNGHILLPWEPVGSDAALVDHHQREGEEHGESGAEVALDPGPDRGNANQERQRSRQEQQLDQPLRAAV